jgi:hypothetical protein
MKAGLKIRIKNHFPIIEILDIMVIIRIRMKKSLVRTTAAVKVNEQVTLE